MGRMGLACLAVAGASFGSSWQPRFTGQRGTLRPDAPERAGVCNPENSYYIRIYQLCSAVIITKSCFTANTSAAWSAKILRDHEKPTAIYPAGVYMFRQEGCFKATGGAKATGVSDVVSVVALSSVAFTLRRRLGGGRAVAVAARPRWRAG